MKTNLHTHTARCGHATGMDEDYVTAALSQGFDVLGFSDHVPWPYEDGYTHPSVRMRLDQMNGYLSSMRALKDGYKKKLRILAGFECEYFPAYMGWLREKAEENALDYLILGNHYAVTDETGMYFGRTTTAAQLARYTELTIEGLRTGLFSELCHPDLFMKRWPGSFDENCRNAARDLCAACLSISIPMEYNVHQRYASPNGEAGYPSRAFFEIVSEMGVPVVLGLDAHHPEELSDPFQWDRGMREMRELGLTVLPMPRLLSFGRADGDE